MPDDYMPELVALDRIDHDGPPPEVGEQCGHVGTLWAPGQCIWCENDRLRKELQVARREAIQDCARYLEARHVGPVLIRLYLELSQVMPPGTRTKREHDLERELAIAKNYILDGNESLDNLIAYATNPTVENMRLPMSERCIKVRDAIKKLTPAACDGGAD